VPHPARLAAAMKRATLLRRLRDLLVVAFAVAARRENERWKAAALLIDMGFDDCPVCLANRR